VVAMRHDGFTNAATIRVRPVLDPAAWEECRTAQAGATAFHRWEWLRIMARALDKHLLPLGFYRAGQAGALVGLAPLLVRHYGPLKSVSWVPLPYLGPLVPGVLLPEALRALDEYQRRNGIGLLRLGFAPDADVDPAALERAGFDLCGDTTMVLPLAGRAEEQLWAALKYQRRQNIRRARDAGVVVAPATAAAARVDRRRTGDYPARPARPDSGPKRTCERGAPTWVRQRAYQSSINERTGRRSSPRGRDNTSDKVRTT